MASWWDKLLGKKTQPLSGATRSRELDRALMRCKRYRPGDPAGRVRDAWTAVQLASAGTTAFHFAASILCDAAADAEYDELALSSARMFVANMELMQSAASTPETPVGYMGAITERVFPSPPGLGLMFPVRAATRYWHAAPDVWVPILRAACDDPHYKRFAPHLYKIAKSMLEGSWE